MAPGTLMSEAAPKGTSYCPPVVRLDLQIWEYTRGQYRVDLLCQQGQGRVVDERDGARVG